MRKMKFSDQKKLHKANENFAAAMVDYFHELRRIEQIDPDADQLNTLANEIRKLTKTVRRIAETNLERGNEEL